MTGPVKRYAAACPPHRTTDAQYAEWMANWASTLPAYDTLLTNAERRAHRDVETEAAVWTAALDNTLGATQY